ncbi:MAG: response regulator [Bacteroidales bacterium]|nr:response regulator [Bacteroidales bacterium]
MEKEKLVFIVDDENIILSLVEYVIGSQAGIRLQTFSSVDECLAALSMEPDLVVTDHHFGNQGDQPATGLDLLRSIRKVQKDLPVLVLSSHDDPLLKEQYRKEGATGYLTKNDYFVNDLEDTIKKYLNL